jgi:hypothetical protein
LRTKSTRKSIKIYQKSYLYPQHKPHPKFVHKTLTLPTIRDYSIRLLEAEEVGDITWNASMRRAVTIVAAVDQLPVAMAVVEAEEEYQATPRLTWVGCLLR